MIITSNGNLYTVDRTSLQFITWDYCKTLLTDIQWQEGDINGMFCNVKIVEGEVVMVESCIGRCFIKKDMLQSLDNTFELDIDFKRSVSIHTALSKLR
jgi:hypothetical protein